MKVTPDVLIKRRQWAADGAAAWNEYLAAPGIAAAKTVRLRQERLERDAAATLEKIASQAILLRGRRAKTVPPKRSRPVRARADDSQVGTRKQKAPAKP